MKNDEASYNSALRWLPPLMRAGLPIPRTEIVLVDEAGHAALEEALDRSREAGAEFQAVLQTMRAAALRIGYPVFVRSDQVSAKHWGEEECRAGNEREIGRVMASAFEACYMADQEFRAYLVREFLALRGAFRMHNGLLVAREWRLFADAATAPCAHFYWEWEALEERVAPERVADWETLSAALSSEDERALGKLARAAVMAVNADLGLSPETAWSVDFAQRAAGGWVLIDMALAQDSWHPAHEPEIAAG